MPSAMALTFSVLSVLTFPHLVVSGLAPEKPQTSMREAALSMCPYGELAMLWCNVLNLSDLCCKVSFVLYVPAILGHRNGDSDFAVLQSRHQNKFRQCGSMKEPEIPW